MGYNSFLVGDCCEVSGSNCGFFGVGSCFVYVYVDDDFVEFWNLYFVGVGELFLYCFVDMFNVFFFELGFVFGFSY